MFIISFVGNKGHGKNSCANLLVEKLPDVSFQMLGFADPIKEACKDIFGWDESYFDGKKKETIDKRWNISPRQAMQYLGTEVGQFGLGETYPKLDEKIGRQLWARRLTNEHDLSKSLIITDMRFPHENDWISDYAVTMGLGYYAIRVERPSVKHDDTHLSETEYMNIPVDCVVENKRKSDLSQQMDVVIAEVLNGGS